MIRPPRLSRTRAPSAYPQFPYTSYSPSSSSYGDRLSLSRAPSTSFFPRWDYLFRRNRRAVRVLLGVLLLGGVWWMFMGRGGGGGPDVSVRVLVGFGGGGVGEHEDEHEHSWAGRRGGVGERDDWRPAGERQEGDAGRQVRGEAEEEEDESVRWAMDQERALNLGGGGEGQPLAGGAGGAGREDELPGLDRAPRPGGRLRGPIAPPLPPPVKLDQHLEDRPPLMPIRRPPVPQQEQQEQTPEQGDQPPAQRQLPQPPPREPAPLLPDSRLQDRLAQQRQDAPAAAAAAAAVGGGAAGEGGRGRRPSWEDDEEDIFRLWNPQQGMQHRPPIAPAPAAAAAGGGPAAPAAHAGADEEPTSPVHVGAGDDSDLWGRVVGIPKGSGGEGATADGAKQEGAEAEGEAGRRAVDHALPPAGMMDPSGSGQAPLRGAEVAGGAEGATGELQEHMWLENGLVQVNPRGKHPIYSLLSRAREEWREKLSRQSRTLAHAVAEYQRRYGRRPPKGFDKWWEYVRRHSVGLPDEYDQIMRDLEPWWGVRPREVRRAQAAARGREGTFSLASSRVRGEVSLSGTNLAKGEEEKRGLLVIQGVLDLLRGGGESWVDEETGERTSVGRELVRATGDWEATWNVHDVPREVVSWEVDNERRTRARAGEVVELGKKASPPQGGVGWAAACPPNSLLRLSYPPEPELPLPEKEPKTFIHSHRTTMDACSNPELVHLSGLLLGQPSGPKVSTEPALLFGASKTGLFADILSVDTQGWVEEVEADMDWELKADERLLWRGSTTGVMFAPENRWAASQRIRFMDLMGVHDPLVNVSVLLPQPEDTAVGAPEPRSQSWMNELFADAAFARGPVQCVPAACEALWQLYEFRAFMRPPAQTKYKYTFDLDGNGRSVRFQRLMRSKSLVLKATAFPEWWTDRVQPWVHYVPVQIDLSDLYDILTFFRGDVADAGVGGHDEVAKEIAYAGKEWAERYWRKEDMVAYLWRLMLEYARVGNDAREYMYFDL